MANRNSSSNISGVRFTGGLSFSRIDCYQKCPQLFRFQYIDKIERPRTPALAIGQTFHEFVEHYLRHLKSKGYETDYDAARRIAEEVTQKSDLNDEETSDFWSLAENFIGAFVFHKEHQATAVVEAELAFNRNWERCGWLDPDVFFRAKLDLHYVPQPGVCYIEDWKTNRRLPARSSVQNSLQLRMYAFVLSLLYPDVEEFQISLFFVRYLEDYFSQIFRPEAEKTRESIESIARKIEQDRRFSPKISSHCEYCPYRGMCDAYKEALARTGLQAVTDPASALQLAEHLYVLQQRVAELQRILKAWVEENAPIQVGDMRLGFEAREKWSVDARKAVDYMLNQLNLDKDSVWKALSITKTSMAKAKLPVKDVLEAVGEKKVETRFGFQK